MDRRVLLSNIRNNVHATLTIFFSNKYASSRKCYPPPSSFLLSFLPSFPVTFLLSALLMAFLSALPIFQELCIVMEKRIVTTTALGLAQLNIIDYTYSLLQSDQTGCRAGNAEKVSSSQAESGQAIKSAVA